MQVNLSQLDSGQLSVDLSAPGAAPALQQHVKLLSTERLRGLLTTQPGAVSLRNVEAKQAVLESLRLIFGRVAVAFQGSAPLTGIQANYASNLQTTLDLRLQHLQVPRLSIDVGQTHVSGETTLENAHLRVVPGDGSVEAEQLQLSAFELNLGDARVTAESLTAKPVRIGWGDAGLSIRGQHVQVSNLRVELKQVTLSVEQVQVEGLDFLAGDIRTQGVHMMGLRASINVGGASASESATPATATDPATPATPTEPASGGTDPRPLPWVHWDLLDALHGRVHVDVGMDVSLPVIKRRRAVHRLRVVVEDGHLDYRDLESDLSGLEESLLDFSLRDQALVLELGIPLLPTRGLGKALVRWPLEAADFERAHQRKQVRLAKLVQPQLPSRSVPPGPPQRPSSRPPAVALRALAFRNIDAGLSLSWRELPHAAIVRHLAVGSLRITGEAKHNPGQLEELEGPTQVHAAFSDVQVELEPLTLGEKTLSMQGLNLPGLGDVRLDFEQLRPTAVELVVAELSLAALTLAPPPSRNE